MNISAGMQANLASVQSALQMVMLRQSMGQTGDVVNALMEGMPEPAAQIAIPGLGENIDISV